MNIDNKNKKGLTSWSDQAMKKIEKLSDILLNLNLIIKQPSLRPITI